MKTLIIDGNNLVWRCQWVAKNVMHVDDQSFLGVSIFLNAIRSYYDRYSPDKLICCWDEKLEYRQNPRKALNPDYKANRDSESNKDIHSKNEYIKDFIETLGGKNLFPRELEADDIICYLCQTLPGKKIIVSVDKDLLQLINEDVVVFSPIKKEELNINNIADHLGHELEHFVTYKAIRGDTSDNIRGLYRFGDKKISQYIEGTLALNEEQQAILDQNLVLMDLNHGYSKYPEEEQYYKDQMDAPFPNQDWKKFIFMCNDLDFQKILLKKEKWYETFFQKTTMVNIVNHLFQ